MIFSKITWEFSILGLLNQFYGVFFSTKKQALYLKKMQFCVCFLKMFRPLKGMICFILNNVHRGLLDAKAWVRIPVQSSKMKYKKIFLRRLPLSRFLAKTLRVNKTAMKKFLKTLSFGVDVKLQVPPLTYKINAHNMSGVRSQAVILTEGL